MAPSSRSTAPRFPAPRRAAWILAICLTTLPCGAANGTALRTVRALQEQGRFADSIAPLRELLASAPGDCEANQLLGVALLKTGQPGLALWRLHRASTSSRCTVVAGALLAELLLADGNSEAAAVAADRVLAVDQRHVAAIRARAAANLAVHRNDRALEDAERLLLLQPSDIGGLDLRARALVALERFDEAEEVQARLTRMAEGTNGVVAARACMAQADFFERTRRDPARAEAAFADCAARYSTDPLVRHIVGNFFEKQGKPDEVVALWRAAHARRPDDLLVRWGLAAHLEERGEVDAARALIVEATREGASPEAWQQLGEFHRRHGDLESADRAFARVAELGAGGSDLLSFTRADLRVQMGDLEGAEKLAGDIESEGLRELMRAQILVARGEYRAALAAFDRGLPYWPNNSAARLTAGRTAEYLGDLVRATEEYHAAIRADRSNAEAVLAAVSLHLALGDYDAVLGLVKIHSASTDRLESDLAVAAARAAAALKRFDEARVWANHVGTPPESPVAAVVELAAVERASSGSRAAADLIENSRLDLTLPENEPALRELVDDNLAAGDWEAARNAAAAAVARFPKSAAFHNILGRALLAAGSRREARTALERAVGLDPQYAPALSDLAVLEVQEGHTAEALRLFDRAARADPLESEYRYRAAQLLLANGRTDEARERLEEVLRISPGHIGACNDLAWLLASEKRELDRALVLAGRASQLGPSADTHDTLGWVRLQRGEVQAAIAAFEQALAADPQAAPIRERLELARGQIVR